MGIVGSGAQAQEAEKPSLAEEFSRASDEYGVPQELLRAMGYVNTLWEMPPPDASPYEPGDLHGRGAYGLMQLQQNPSKDTLGRAAQLTGLTEEELKNDRAANVSGGAAVLADIAGEDKPSDLDGWFDAVAEYGGTPLYAEQVYETLKSGASGITSDGEKLELTPREGVETKSGAVSKAAGQYGGSTWYGAHPNNYYEGRTYRRETYDIDKIVIHVTQGSWSGSLSWFQDSRAGSSAHYTVRSSDGKIGQSVREGDTAYHAGHWYTNLQSIGIEHEGYVSAPNRWFTDAMYRSSARLSAYLAKKYRIPIDRNHIIGHGQVPGCPGTGGGVSCHTDPGSGWNWDKYMSLVRSYAGAGGGGAPSPYTQTVDNASPRFEASSRWIASTFRQAQSYGTNHRVLRTPLSFDDNAKFKLRAPARDKYSVYARWPADAGYNYRTTFLVRGLNGWNKVVRTQRANGGKWVSLGDYTFPAGDSYKVQVSSRSPVNGYIVADAVKIVRR
ncbi:N-acetylmuramoyl-L-alanine amidase [Rubrobacter tropicus]|nr:N-acetylmuramoyl-L-alanine amidase [Rubrobacter tropicus]